MNNLAHLIPQINQLSEEHDSLLRELKIEFLRFQLQLPDIEFSCGEFEVHNRKIFLGPQAIAFDEEFLIHFMRNFHTFIASLEQAASVIQEENKEFTNFINLLREEI